jgi:D-alanine-D-alanine ligase
MKTDAKILICYNSPASIFPVYNGKPAESTHSYNDLSETGFLRGIGKIRKKLLKNFTSVETLAVDRNVSKIINKINSHSPDVIFNFVESVEGISHYEYCSAGLFELLGYQYTGNTPFCLGNCLNKERTKNILRSFKVRTPRSVVIHIDENITPKKLKLKFPVIIKLLNEDASIGISEFSVVKDFGDLKNIQSFFLKLTNRI